MNRLQLLGRYIKPSLLSLTLCVGLSLALVAATALSFGAKSGSLYEFILGAEASAGTIGSLQETFTRFTFELSASKMLAVSSTFLFWSAVGLVAYSLCEFLIIFVQDSIRVREELGYVNAGRRHLMRNLGGRMLARFFVGLWTVLLGAFFVQIIWPYCVASIHIASFGEQSLASSSFLLLAIGLLALSLHAITILMRMFFLRPRLFSGIVSE